MPVCSEYTVLSGMTKTIPICLGLAIKMDLRDIKCCSHDHGPCHGLPTSFETWERNITWSWRCDGPKASVTRQRWTYDCLTYDILWWEAAEFFVRDIFFILSTCLREKCWRIAQITLRLSSSISYINLYMTRLRSNSIQTGRQCRQDAKWLAWVN